ncbi:hypothetical protein QQF64_020504 [Cirrhinus molitorella]|uniref:Uncharacterized protein n=1 Tax=Cirrhinus molitorella TaxID=172907 RepID=A0ABR3L9B6_9TELE
MAANLANERPIDARTQSREDCVEYVTPNSLLLGRSGPKGDPGDFDFVGYFYKRLKVIQGKVNKVKVSDKGKKSTKKVTNKIPATILHRDVRRLVVLIPIEEQS